MERGKNIPPKASVMTASAIPSQGQSETKSTLPVSGRRTGCVLCRTELREPCLWRSLPGPLHASLYRFPLAYGLVEELHSLLHHMALRWKLRFGSYFLYISPEEMLERRQPNTRTHSYMRDMRSFAERHPWATILDLEMYRDAWLAGAEWGSHTCTKGQETSLNQA